MFGFPFLLNLYSDVTIGCLDYIVRDTFEFFLNFIKFASHEALDREERVLRIEAARHEVDLSALRPRGARLALFLILVTFSSTSSVCPT